VFAKDCIDASIPFLRISDSVEYALDLMQEFKAEALAVVEDGKYIGLLSEQFLLELDNETSFANIKEHFLPHKIFEETHVFDVLKYTSENVAFFIPVVQAENEYIGIVSPQKLIQVLANNASLVNNGGILVLEIESRNYSLTEISKIVESNNAMILHSMISPAKQPSHVFVSLKINKDDLKDIQLSFERYEYQVIAVLHQSEYELQLRERYDSLMRYLEV
jgi:acetoin utilization protein AcuB